jgi:hypothetical protein
LTWLLELLLLCVLQAGPSPAVLLREGSAPLALLSSRHLQYNSSQQNGQNGSQDWIACRQRST